MSHVVFIRAEDQMERSGHYKVVFITKPALFVNGNGLGRILNLSF